MFQELIYLNTYPGCHKTVSTPCPKVIAKQMQSLANCTFTYVV